MAIDLHTARVISKGAALNVSPNSSYYNLPNQSVRNSKSVSQTAPANFFVFVNAPYFFNNVFGQNGSTVKASSWVLAFRNAIEMIFKRGSNPKMIRIYAQRIIGIWSAIMKHVQAIWNCASKQKPGKSMCGPFLTVEIESAVISRYCSSPNPTRTRSFYEPIKPELWVFETQPGATSCFAQAIIFGIEFFATNQTLVGVHLKALFLGVQRLVVRAINLVFFKASCLGNQGFSI